MNRFFPILALTVLTQTRIFAQAAATDQAAAPAPSPAPTPTFMAPPPDSAPAVTPTTANDAGPAPTPLAKPAPMTAGDIARIQQQEIIRRQELVFRANQALKTAQKAELGDNNPEARKNYLFAAEAYSSISRSTTNYAQAAEGLTRVDLQLYDEALKIGDTLRAKALVDEVLKYNPNNKSAAAKELAINQALANPNDTSLLGNPAVTPGFVAKVTEVQQLFSEAEQFRRTGQWDQAEARLKRILGIDPYNIAATQQLQKIDAEKYEYAEHARLEYRTEALRQIEEKWYEPIVNKDSGATAQDAQEVLTTRTNTFDIDQKLKGIFLSLDFTNATIESATSFLSSESKNQDPEHKGVNFIIQPLASSSAKPITISLNHIPLGEALRYVCQLANVKFKVQDYAISIVPFNQSTDDLISRTFNVPPSFIAPPSATGAISSVTAGFGGRPIPQAADAAPAAATESDPVRAALEAKGVTFVSGASAVYTAPTGQLTVVDTADQMELIEELVNAGQAPTVMVKISAKFVEINQQDLNDLTVNSAFNYYNPITQALTTATNLLPGTKKDAFALPAFNTALRGSLGFAPNSIDQLISPQTSTFNSIFFRAMLDGVQYNAVLNSLSQKKSFDLLSEPFALTKSGDQGSLEAVRVFPYPIAFDPPETVTQTNNTATTTLVVLETPPVIIATTPTDFKKRNVGVRLVVKPQASPDNQTVDLSLFPEVTDFQGFINYGSPIYVGNPNGSSSLLSTNDINQPVFNTRRINTRVTIKDGSTVMLGGLIREDVQNINDKVPILGDLPLVGRLFQSKAVENTKRNLIIFVTANIYRNDGELLNPPEEVHAADVLTNHANFTRAGTP